MESDKKEDTPSPNGFTRLLFQMFEYSLRLCSVSSSVVFCFEYDIHKMIFAMIFAMILTSGE